MSVIPWAVMAAASGTVAWLDPVAPTGPESVTTTNNHLRMMFENDCAFGEDRDYSHGTRFDYAHSLSQENSLSLSDAWGISISQNIYTPTTHTRWAVPGEHPYAGDFRVGGAYMQRWHNFGHCVELQVGMMGKAAFARDTQNFVHKIGNMEQWDGWGSQAPSEAAVQFSARQDYRLSFLETHFANGWETDAMCYTQENIGTLHIDGRVGFNVRIGTNLPTNLQMTRSGGANYGLGLLLKESYNPAATSAFFSLGGDVGYYARDYGIDGGVFHRFENKTVSRRPWQAELRSGVGVSRRNVDYFAGAVYHTPTYRHGKGSLYGCFSITLNW